MYVRPLQLHSQKFEESGLRKRKPNTDDYTKARLSSFFLKLRVACIFKNFRDELEKISSTSTKITLSKV